MASFGEEASDDPARGVRRRRRMNQSAFFRVVIIRLGLFLSNQMIPTNIMGNAKNFEEISRDADEPSARKEEERERRTVSSTPDRSRRFFFSLSGAKRRYTHNTNKHQQKRRERDKRRVKKGPQKKAQKSVSKRRFLRAIQTMKKKSKNKTKDY